MHITGHHVAHNGFNAMSRNSRLLFDVQISRGSLRGILCLFTSHRHWYPSDALKRDAGFSQTLFQLFYFVLFLKRYRNRISDNPLKKRELWIILFGSSLMGNIMVRINFVLQLKVAQSFFYSKKALLQLTRYGVLSSDKVQPNIFTFAKLR